MTKENFKMRKNIIKTACVTAATALMLGVFATPQTEVFNQTVNTQAKKAKKITKYFSKKQQKKYKLPSRLKDQEIRKYYKNGRLKSITKTQVYVYTKYNYSNKSTWTEYYFNTKKKKVKLRHFQAYTKQFHMKKWNKVRDYKHNFSKKSGKVLNSTYIEGAPYVGGKWAKHTRKYTKKGKFYAEKFYVYRNGKYQRVSKKEFHENGYYRDTGTWYKTNYLKKMQKKKEKYIY